MMTNPTGRITQGQFSFLPDLTDAEITLQIDYGLGKGYAWSVEYTDDPHPRNTYWEMFGMPMFDLKDAAGVMLELQNCRKTFPNHYIRLMAFDSTRGVEIDRDELHRQPARQRARLRPGAAGGQRPLDALHGAQLRHRQARRPSATATVGAAMLPHRPFDPLGRLRAPRRGGARRHRRRRRLDPLRRDGQPLRAEPDHRPGRGAGHQAALRARRRQPRCRSTCT